MSRSAKPLKPVLMLVLATAFWSVSFPTTRALLISQQTGLPGVSTWFLASWCVALRFGLAALVLLLWSAKTLRQITRSEIHQGLGLGLFLAAGLVLQVDGLAYTSASVSAFLTQCYVLLLPLWTAVVERKWPSWRIGCSCALVLVGVAVLSRLDWHHLELGRGEWETLLASVLFTGQILFLQRPSFARNKVAHFSTVMFLVVAGAGLVAAALSRHHPGDWAAAYHSPVNRFFVAILIGFSTLGGFLLMNHWQPRVRATEAGLIYCAEPVFASLTALVLPGWFSALAGIHYPNETLRASLVIGGGLITAANLLIQFQPQVITPPAVASRFSPSLPRRE